MGTTEYTLEIPITNDTRAEPNESFGITVVDLCDDEAIVTIRDDDRIAADIDADRDSIAEGDNVTFMISLRSRTSSELATPTALPNAIQITVSDYPGSDFIPQAFESTRHTVALNTMPGQTTVTASFTVRTVDNNQDDRVHRILAEISAPPDYDSIIRGVATVSVLDDEPRVSIAAAAEGIYKGEDAVFTVELDTLTENNTTVGLRIVESGDEDFIDSQYEDMIQTVIVPAGSTRAEYTIPTARIDDGNSSAVGGVTASIVFPSNETYVLGEPNSATIAIVDVKCGYIIDVDADDDGLIEICDLDGLNEIRYSLDGSGHKANPDAPLNDRGCDEDGDNDGVCRGYELTRDLDFNDADSYRSGRVNRNWIESVGWPPIGTILERFSGQFEANDRNIANLYINRPTINNVGLFRETAPSATIRLLRLSNVNITGRSGVGALVGINEGIVGAVDIINGRVIGRGDNIGGVVGISEGAVVGVNILLDAVSGGRVERRCRDNLEATNCADAEKVATVLENGINVGGLIGDNNGNVANNFVSIDVLGASRVGGLIGFSSAGVQGGNVVIGNVRGNEYTGGLIGYSIHSVVDSSSNADVVVNGSYAGGLIGYACRLRSGTRRCLLPGEVLDSAGSALQITGSSSRGDVEGGDYSGGLIGFSSIAITGGSSRGNVTGGDYSGGLVGYSSDDIVDSVVEDGRVSARDYVGGLVGFHSGRQIINGKATGITLTGGSNLGGLVGMSEVTTAVSVITDAVAEGSIVGDTVIGGLVGHASALRVTDSTADVPVTAMDSDAENVGGLIGRVESGSITGSRASGDVRGSFHIGGLVGNAGQSRIGDSYATGDVNATAHNVGGLVGSINGTRIEDSYATGDVRGSYHIGGLVGIGEQLDIGRSYAIGNVNGSAYNIGGLAGYLNRGNITFVYATGSVIGDNGAGPGVNNSVDNVGGLVGRADGISLVNGYAINATVSGVDRVGGLIGIQSEEGSVRIAYARSAVRGTNRVGGLIGDNNGRVATTYAAGRVSANGSDVGGLIGYNQASRVRIFTDGRSRG